MQCDLLHPQLTLYWSIRELLDAPALSLAFIGSASAVASTAHQEGACGPSLVPVIIFSASPADDLACHVDYRKRTANPDTIALLGHAASPITMCSRHRRDARCRLSGRQNAGRLHLAGTAGFNSLRFEAVCRT
jgi:hypothetical protein